jgi:K+-sensing histidine kinase KdpD
VAGVVVRDYDRMTAARAKMLRKSSGADPIAAADIERAKDGYLASRDAYEKDLQAGKAEALSEYRNSKGFASDWLTNLQPQIRQALGQVHDYKQFVAQIIQNLNVILQTKYPGLTTDEMLVKASHEEVSIYWAARLMEEKLVAALFLLNPERVGENQVHYSFHKMVTKYRKIYARAFDAKNVRVISTGSSFGYVYGNAVAVGVIPHTFIDNALKYSPPGSEVTIDYTEDERSIRLAVASYGPKIFPDEDERIFDPFYRGRAARDVANEGTGFGLGLAKVIAQASGVRLSVEQSENESPRLGYLTTFRAQFERAHPAWEGGEELVRSETED